MEVVLFMKTGMVKMNKTGCFEKTNLVYNNGRSK